MFMKTAGKNRVIGFTLIEIMLVVIIIGILAAFMVPRFTGKQETAKIAKARLEISSLSAMLDSMHLDIDRFPTEDEGLRALMERPPALAPEIEWNGPYTRELALDPWGRPYQYRYPGQWSPDFDLWSLGPDGEEDTDDDIRNMRSATEAAKGY